jgi:hypothetical protein
MAWWEIENENLDFDSAVLAPGFNIGALTKTPAFVRKTAPSCESTMNGSRGVDDPSRRVARA